MLNQPIRLRLAIGLFKCRLGLPVVRERSGVVTIKLIDMYIVHDSSLVVSFSNILAYFAETLIMLESSRESCSRRFSLHPVPIVWQVAGRSQLVFSFQMSFRPTYCP